MSKQTKTFEVIVTRDLTESATILVQAKSPKAAGAAALRMVEADQGGYIRFAADEGNIPQDPYLGDETSTNEVDADLSPIPEGKMPRGAKVALLAPATLLTAFGAVNNFDSGEIFHYVQSTLKGKHVLEHFDGEPTLHVNDEMFRAIFGVYPKEEYMPEEMAKELKD